VTGRTRISTATPRSASHTATLFLLTRDARVVARIDHVNNPRDLSAAIASAVNIAIMERY
jgi:hypothetical protein